MINDSLCVSEGLSIPEKGMHQDGTKLQAGEQSIYSKNLYQLLMRVKEGKAKSYVLECIKAVAIATEQAISKVDFMERLFKDGWETKWEEKRKYIVFSDSEGHRIRNAKIEKLTGIDCSKEALLERFKLNDQKNDVRLLAQRAADIRGQYIDVYCRRVQAEKELDVMPVTFTKHAMKKIKSVQNKLRIKDSQIKIHEQNYIELQAENKKTSVFYTVQKQKIKCLMRIEEQAIDQLKRELQQLLTQNGYAIRDDFEADIIQSQQEYDVKGLDMGKRL